MSRSRRLTAIIPCNDLDASEAFYGRLGFARDRVYEGYRLLSDGRGAELHLSAVAEGWLVPSRNPFGVYLYAEDVDELAARMGKKAEHKPWGMYEFAVADPDETLVRVGWPSEESRG